MTNQHSYCCITHFSFYTVPTESNRVTLAGNMYVHQSATMYHFVVRTNGWNKKHQFLHKCMSTRLVRTSIFIQFVNVFDHLVQGQRFESRVHWQVHR